MFTIAIIGRPNVGKSTLFNKLVGHSVAIVNDFAGVTRDRKDAVGYLGPLKFKIIDTAGWNTEISKEKLEHRMIEQTEIAIREADLCLFVVERAGVSSIDETFARKLRASNIPCILIVNKCDNIKINQGFDREFYKLGFGEPIGISAEHKNGFNFLYDAIEPYYNEYEKKVGDVEEISNGIEVDKKDDENKSLQIAIVGRPNSGKSTLINTLLGKERVITGPEAGITRDSIAIDWKYKNKKITLVDTAGIRKKRNIDKDLEQLSVGDSMRSINYAQVVIMVLDANYPFDTQDLAIASILIREGRGVVFALNKWDTIDEKNKHNLINSVIGVVENNLSEVKGCPVIPISAINGKNIDKLMEAVFLVFKNWDFHISTSKLNQWLRFVETENTPPLYRGKVTKLKYITQAKKRPPTFVLFTNSPDRLEQTSYSRFLVNKLREDFNLKNTVVRLLLRKAENPYSDVKSKNKRK
jgi:GTP-binding protein